MQEPTPRRPEHLDPLAEIASKMNALVQRGAPRDFTDLHHFFSTVLDEGVTIATED